MHEVALPGYILSNPIGPKLLGQLPRGTPSRSFLEFIYVLAALNFASEHYRSSYLRKQVSRIYAAFLDASFRWHDGRSWISIRKRLNETRYLVAQTCASPPTLVGQLLGGAIAARFAVKRAGPVSRLVLIDTFGLTPFDPAPEFGLAINDYLAQPTEHTHERLWRHCAFDLDGLRRRMGQRWEPFAAYNLDRARMPSVQSAFHVLMQQFGLPAMAPADLARISVPTTLIWGRHDRGTPLSIAEAASARYRWPLHVIDNASDDPPIEQPEALLHALRTALARAR